MQRCHRARRPAGRAPAVVRPATPVVPRPARSRQPVLRRDVGVPAPRRHPRAGARDEPRCRCRSSRDPADELRQRRRQTAPADRALDPGAARARRSRRRRAGRPRRRARSDRPRTGDDAVRPDHVPAAAGDPGAARPRRPRPRARDAPHHHRWLVDAGVRSRAVHPVPVPGHGRAGGAPRVAHPVRGLRHLATLRRAVGRRRAAARLLAGAPRWAVDRRTADRSPPPGHVLVPRRRRALRHSGRRVRPADRVRPWRARHDVHGRLRGVGESARPLRRPDRHRGGSSDRRSRPTRARAPGGLLPQQPRRARRPRRRPHVP